MPPPRPSGYIYLPILFVVSMLRPAIAESCIAPPRPFVPSDPAVAQQYADLIRRDFELYIEDIQSYFRCLDSERARAFEEARAVSREYDAFLKAVGD